MKKLPIGIQTFSDIITGNYCYVDKTPMVSRLVEEGKYYFLSRPRRFGKSLLLDTIAEAFLGNKDLFQGLYLEKHWDWNKQSPVICIDFAEGFMQSRELLDESIRAALNNCAEDYGVELTSKAVHLLFSELIRKLHKSTGKKVVVLIDEYDKPILDNITEPEKARELREGLKNIYSVVKGQDARLRFVMLTGVSKFSKVSLFSGLYNLVDITLDSRSATLCGYTQNELVTVFAEHLDGVDIVEVQRWYNGYNFLGEPVYNPFDVLLYLRSREFRNYWFETGTPTFLIQLLKKRCYQIPDIENIEAGEMLLGSFDIDFIEPETLLFQTGYLTIKERTQQAGWIKYSLVYPNREVRMSLTNAILEAYVPNQQEKIRAQNSVLQAIINGEPDRINNTLYAFFASIPFEWYVNNKLEKYEGYYASIVYCYFASLGLDVRPEEPSSRGRSDMAVLYEDKVYILEFKVKECAESAASALEQIKKQGYADKYRGEDREVYLVGIEFSSKERNITGFDWERG